MVKKLLMLSILLKIHQRGRTFLVKKNKLFLQLCLPVQILTSVKTIEILAFVKVNIKDSPKWNVPIGELLANSFQIFKSITIF